MVYIQDFFDGMPKDSWSIRRCWCVSEKDTYINSIKFGEVYYIVIKQHLVAFKLLGIFVDSINEVLNLLYIELPDGTRTYLREDSMIEFRNLIFKSKEDYYDYVGGKDDARLKMRRSYLPEELLSKLKRRCGYPKDSYYARNYYKFDSYRQRAIPEEGSILRLFYDGTNWYVQSSVTSSCDMKDYAHASKYYHSKSECIKDNVITSVVDFEDEPTEEVEVTIKIDITKSQPKMKKIIVIEE